MKLEFQEDLLKFLVQKPEAKKYIEILDGELFDLDTHFTVFGLLKGFITKYRSQPSLGNMLEYFDRELKSKQSKGENLGDVYSEVEETVRNAYEPFRANADQIREVVLEEYQVKLLTTFWVKEAGNIKSATSDSIKDLHKKLTEIKRIGETDLEEEDENRGRFALSQFEKGQKSLVDGAPTYLRALNDLTSTKGFYSPQLVVLMGAPKSFKTGTLLNIAINYVRNGKKVYYVDCENGEDRILDRFYQGMLEATYGEYNSGELDDVLEEMVKRFSVMGGDFRADFFPANTKSVADVEAELDILAEQGWIPDLICWDYLDLMIPIDYKIKEKRLQIQAVYFDAIRLQKKRKMFGISLSQVNKNAVDKAVIDMTGFAEDFGKAANCHAAFALCRTADEKEVGLMRILPVVQRDGVAQHSKGACYTLVDESKMSVKEITRDAASKLLSTVVKTVPETRKPLPRPKKIRDE